MTKFETYRTKIEILKVTGPKLKLKGLKLKIPKVTELKLNFEKYTWAKLIFSPEKTLIKAFIKGGGEVDLLGSSEERVCELIFLCFNKVEVSVFACCCLHESSTFPFCWWGSCLSVWSKYWLHVAMYCSDCKLQKYVYGSTEKFHPGDYSLA